MLDRCDSDQSSIAQIEVSMLQFIIELIFRMINILGAPALSLVRQVRMTMTSFVNTNGMEDDTAESG
jgi:hypothetical protein